LNCFPRIKAADDAELLAGEAVGRRGDMEAMVAVVCRFWWKGFGCDQRVVTVIDLRVASLPRWVRCCPAKGLVLQRRSGDMSLKRSVESKR